MRICMFGAYQHDDERNRIFFKALQSADLACVECHSRLPSTSRRYRQLYQRYQEVAQDGVDAIYVGKIGHGDVPLAWALGRRYGVPVFFDAFVSMFDTYVNDRQRHGRYSAKALYYYLLDYQAAHLAQHVVLDTTAHIDYFARTFHVNRHKFRLLPIGADDTVFFRSKIRRLRWWTRRCRCCSLGRTFRCTAWT
ncbi:MAG: hypothetical protein R2873_24100 [Caldilineaceae bacterium]